MLQIFSIQKMKRAVDFQIGSMSVLLWIFIMDFTTFNVAVVKSPLNLQTTWPNIAPFNIININLYEEKLVQLNHMDDYMVVLFFFFFYSKPINTILLPSEYIYLLQIIDPCHNKNMKDSKDVNERLFYDFLITIKS